MKVLNKKVFVAAIVDGRSQTKAYIDAGGSPKSAGSNAGKLAKTPAIKKAINEAMQAKVLNSLTKLPSLTEAAMNKLGELILSPDDKIALQASKIALDKAREFLPKEVNISHVHEVTGDDENNENNARMLAIAAKLQGKAASGDGFAGKLLDSAREGGSGGVQADGDGAGVDGEEPEYAVYTEQEAEVST